MGMKAPYLSSPYPPKGPYDYKPQLRCSRHQLLGPDTVFGDLSRIISWLKVHDGLCLRAEGSREFGGLDLASV